MKCDTLARMSNMDKSWMLMDKRYIGYENEVNEFLAR